ncbi:hypothetical protein NEOLI_003962 [Neolecta irregularis DAH-3]|uniref:Uncharacterized protein n=1 Tax=Neolecta irregularis (strain DAH-3) TaxID=1198029 RepID=A0A1U7LVH3_NEOID|nr:hypothetical protein NEOLI_003962 [Neolecta irregularis DAH-3]|eukprot:OLL26676.1 hypothetical protein NEOLI_003962 [Neolecta irregularis DAH-3]
MDSTLEVIDSEHPVPSDEESQLGLHSQPTQHYGPTLMATGSYSTNHEAQHMPISVCSIDKSISESGHHHPTELSSFLSLENEPHAWFDDAQGTGQCAVSASNLHISSKRYSSGGRSDCATQGSVSSTTDRNKPLKELNDSKPSTHHDRPSATGSSYKPSSKSRDGRPQSPSKRVSSNEAQNASSTSNEEKGLSPSEPASSDDLPNSNFRHDFQDDEIILKPISAGSDEGEYIAHFKLNDNLGSQVPASASANAIDHSSQIEEQQYQISQSPAEIPVSGFEKNARRMSTGHYGLLPKTTNYTPGVMGGAQLPREPARPREFGDPIIKTTGFAAEGGNFDASKAGAGVEAQRLLNKPGKGEQAHHPDENSPSDKHSNQSSSLGHSGENSRDSGTRRLSIGEKFKHALHIGSKHNDIKE